MPVSPSTTRSSSPPTAVATTGRPWAIASRQATPKPSRLDGQATTAARAYSCCSSSCGTKPCAPGIGPAEAVAGDDEVQVASPPRRARARPSPATDGLHRAPRRLGFRADLGRQVDAARDDPDLARAERPQPGRRGRGTRRSRAARREAHRAPARGHARRWRRPSPTPGRRTACRCGPRPSRPEASGRAGGLLRQHGRRARSSQAAPGRTGRARAGGAGCRAPRGRTRSRSVRNCCGPITSTSTPRERTCSTASATKRPAASPG